MASNLTKHLNKHNVLYDLQHGFREKRSCETQLIQLIDELARGLSIRGQQTDLILLDFSKAFHKVSHTKLLLKLHQHGITQNNLSWIKTFLLGRSQCDGNIFNLRRLQAKTKVQTKMQRAMDQVSQSCDNCDLTISTKKTEVVHQPAPGKPYNEPVITVNGQKLKVVDKFTYLGSTLSTIDHIMPTSAPSMTCM